MRRKKSSVAAQSSLDASQRRRSEGFRRRSVDAGVTTDIVNIVEIPSISVVGSSDSSTLGVSYLKELVGGFVDTIRPPTMCRRALRSGST